MIRTNGPAHFGNFGDDPDFYFGSASLANCLFEVGESFDEEQRAEYGEEKIVEKRRFIDQSDWRIVDECDWLHDRAYVGPSRDRFAEFRQSRLEKLAWLTSQKLKPD